MHHVNAMSVLKRRTLGLARGIQAPFASLRLEAIGSARLRGPDWIVAKPLLAGLCGSDLAALAGRSSPVLSAFTSFPSVPGHEILAEVVETGSSSNHSNMRVGDRVLIDPFVSCLVRNIHPCRPCQRGETHLCEQTSVRSTNLGPGMMIGYHHDLPGGFSELLMAHVSQLHPVPGDPGVERIPDSVAVLTEPLAVALHAVLAATITGNERTLVIGGGMIGLGIVWALRELGARAPVVLARHAHQVAAAESLGAESAVEVRHGDGTDAVLPRLGGVRPVPALLGRTVWVGGFDLVFDAVGDEASFGESLAACRGGGLVVRAGETGLVGQPRPSPVWAPDTRVIFPFGYGKEPAFSGTHTFDLVLSRLRDHRTDLAGLLTHAYPLDQYREAFRVATRRRVSRSIKVALHPGATGRPTSGPGIDWPRQ